ncbi:MAG: TonB family protein [Rikenellaceae bacterium]|nr:TonB family protein [Rikenellaceae bacterium]
MKRRFLLTIALSVLCTTGLFAQTGAVSRMRKDVMVLTADSLMGRGSATIHEYKAARYIEKVFANDGLELLYPHPGQDFSLLAAGNDTLRSQNVVAIIEGWDPKLKDEYIVIGAHYDHLGYNDLVVNGQEKRQIFRGADDNASGVAVLLELARLVKAESFNFRRSVIFVAFGAEERGMNGSWYFANRAFAHTQKISLMINLDMVGRGSGKEDIDVYTVLPHTQLETVLRDVADMPLMFLPQIHAKDYFPSDHQVFANLGIPVALFTTKLHGDYHTVKDTPDKLNYLTMEHLTQYLLNLSRTVANMDEMLPRTVLAEEFDNSGEKEIYSQVETDQRAAYMKGDERKFMDDWVYHYLRYPQEAIDLGIQGRVVVDFVVERDGTVTDAQVTKSVHHLLDAEALRVIMVSPKWKPATINGKPVRVKISVPVEFKLRKD